MKQYLTIFAILLGVATLSAQTVANLVATGSNIKWYAAAEGGTALPTTSALVNATTYYASQTINGVESTARFAVTATINPQPQGSLSANGPLCATGVGMLTWTKTAGTGPYTVVYNDGTANRTATGVVSTTAFAVFTSPVTSTTTYTLVSVQDAYCSRSSGFTGNTATITVNPLPTPTFTAQPGATANTATDVTYTTESGKTNYIWTYPGTLTTDYTITSGGGNTNSVTLKYVTIGSKTVSINYTTNGCSAASATSSTATTVSSSLLAIGNTYKGGNIFYILVSGDSGFDSNVQHGLIEPGYDQAANTEIIKWSTYPAGVNLPTTSEIGTGMQNTTWLISAYGSSAQAATLCKNLVIGGYSDWYLPSIMELKQLYYYKITGHSNFPGGDYVSSTSNSIDYALAISFNITYYQLTTAFKGNIRCNIRAIRSF